MYKGAQSTIEFFNWLSGTDTDIEKDSSIIEKTKEIIAPSNISKQKSRLLSDFKYYYDDVIFMNLTRYEFGLWLVFAMFYFLRKAMEKCGDRKTIFDFMNPAA